MDAGWRIWGDHDFVEIYNLKQALNIMVPKKHVEELSVSGKKEKK